MGVVKLTMRTWPGNLIDPETRLAIITKLFHKGPMTVKQLADDIGLSSPTILRHVELLVEGELLKEVQVSEEKKAFKRERYYDITFPIWSVIDQKKMQPFYEKIGEKIAITIKEHIAELRDAFEGTELRGKGWCFDDPDIYYEIMSSATCTIPRKALERHGLKPLPETTSNKWGVFGEEVVEDASS